MNPTMELKFGSITRSFSGAHLLVNCNITLQPGRVIMLSGENGSGKTTLLKILSGLLKPDNGFVDFGNGITPWKKSRKLLLEKVMYLHQHPYMFSGSVFQNLALAVPRGLGASEKQEIIEKALEWGMLARYKNTSARALSGGQQQRIALARAWLRQSAYLLLDEPTANMDTQSGIRTIRLLERLKKSGIGIVICSHNMMIYNDLIDQHLVLNDGHLDTSELMEYGGNVSPITSETVHDNIAR